jgi:oligoribonuclease NrnB/cAMP/cGMP phosphodiesterase (DHH superfamily)
MNGPKMMAKLLDIKEIATRKNRATDLKKYLIEDLDMINNRIEEAIRILQEED